MKFTVPTLLFLSIIFSPGCIEFFKTKKEEDAKNSEHVLTSQELQEVMKKEKEIMVVNVLSKESYTNCHIKGSVNVPLNNLKEESKSWDKEKKIIVYCASFACQASVKAYEMLKAMGFKKVYDYKGGIKEWKNKNLPVEGLCK